MSKPKVASMLTEMALGFYDLRVKEQGKIRGVVVQDEETKKVSICVYADPEIPGGKSTVVFPYGCVYIRDEVRL
jgi:hypothetical protein